MSWDSAPRYLVSLVFVLGLIGTFAWALRRFGPPGRFTASRRRRLAIIEVTALDARHRLVLLRRDEREHLILLGPGGGLVIESGIAATAEPAATGFAAPLPDPPPP